jgi:carboxymethylenebutenolidase
MTPTDSEPRAELSRRHVIATALGSGFALATQPISAETVHTASQGLDAGEVKIPTKWGDVPGYRAAPSGKKGLPLVLVVQEIFGVHEHIRDVCRRLAGHGYFALATELFARQGDVSKLSEVSEIRAIVSRVPDAQVMTDLDASVAWAKSTGAVDASKLGMTGFCWGGRITWLYAAHNPALRAGVAWYGRVVGDKTALQPQHPVDIAAKLTAPVLGLYGGKDTGIPLETVEAMRKALAGGGASAKRSEIRVYPEAGHAFFADYRPSFRKADADDAWKRALDWLKRNGVA